MSSVLVVDDDPDIRLLLSEVLELLGCQVVTANDGQQAMAEVGKVRPDLILLDLMMPVMDGRTFGTRVRSQPWGAHLPIVLMSAATEAQQVCREIHAQACLAKPFDLDQVAQLVDQYSSSGDGAG